MTVNTLNTGVMVAEGQFCHDRNKLHFKIYIKINVGVSCNNISQYWSYKCSLGENTILSEMLK